MNYKLCFSCLFLIALFLNTSAQEKGNKTDLKIILSAIATKENVIFNYLEEDIANTSITPPDANWNLKKKLEDITLKTNLRFEFITKTYISVVLNKKPKKIFCGYLKDSQTLEKIENATIYCIDTNIFSVSNENGYFELIHDGIHPIQINHLGYQKIKIDHPETITTCEDIYLNPNPNQLKEVIAEVFLTKGISKKLDGSFEIQPKQFTLLPGLTEPDVFQTMQQLPGITSIDETVSNINVRGGSHDQNLFTWNQIRLFQTGHFYGLISVLNPNLPNKIKIIKNGTSPFYGESVSSTVLVSTENNAPKDQSSIGINLLHMDFNTTLRISNNSSLSLSGRRSYTDAIRTPTYNNYYQRVFQNTTVTTIANDENISFSTDEKFYFYDTSLQFNQKIKEKSTFQVNFITLSNELDLNQSKEENSTIIVKNSTLNQQSIGGSLIFKTNWNPKTSSKATLYGSFYKIDSNNESIIGNQIFTQENTILDTGIQIENNHKLNSLFTFNNGYQFNEIGIQNFDQLNSPSFSRKIKDVLHIHAVITEMEYLSKNQKLNTSFGARQTYISQLNTYIFEPRFRVNYQLSSHFSTQLLAEKKHQTSSQIIDLQQDFLGVVKSRWVLANNENIPIVSSNQIALGVTFKKRNWLFSIDNYLKKVKGVTSKSQGFQNQLELENIIGAYTTYGSEILVQKQLNRFTFWLGYTLSRNKYTFDTFIPKKFPNNFDIQHNLSLGIVYTINPLKIALGSRWFTGRPTTLPQKDTIEGNSIIYNDPNSSNLPNYFQTNLSAGYTFSIKEVQKLQIGASIQNLFNTKNTINQFFRINQNTNTIEKVSTFSLELTPNAYVRYSF